MLISEIISEISPSDLIEAKIFNSRAVFSHVMVMQTNSSGAP